MVLHQCELGCGSLDVSFERSSYGSQACYIDIAFLSYFYVQQELPPF